MTSWLLSCVAVEGLRGTPPAVPAAVSLVPSSLVDTVGPFSDVEDSDTSGGPADSSVEYGGESGTMEGGWNFSFFASPPAQPRACLWVCA